MRPHRVVVVGAGGNIGSHLVPHLGRMASVGRVTLVDRDVYMRSNLEGQDIRPGDVGRRKARVQAQRLAGINPSLDVVAVAAAVEDIPPGWLRADVILACLDSRRARQYVNEAAWHSGVPWIDCGVAVMEAGGLLARVTVYRPGPDRPCLECAWDDRDYDQIEQTYACGAAPAAPPTHAPSSLGALAASLLALECRMLLEGEPDRDGRQVLLDAAHGTLHVTRFNRRSTCRMPDHSVWRIAELPPEALDMTIESAFGLGRDGGHDGEPPDAGGPVRSEAQTKSNAAVEPSLQVEGRSFERRRVCPGCGATRFCLRLQGTLRGGSRCARCAQRMVTQAFDLVERLRLDDLSASERECSLRRVGLRHGDRLRIGGSGGERHFEIMEDRA